MAASIRVSALACLLLATLAASAHAQSSPAPIIGIFTQAYGNDPLPAYIAASYVKYLESAGARVVPIFYDAPLDNLTTIFNQVNGILFPGGGADLATQNTFTIAAEHLWNLAVKANDAGDFFPLWVSFEWTGKRNASSSADERTLRHA